MNNKSPNKNLKMKDWLKSNGYEDVVELILEVESEWKLKGIKTRRNWWEVLAGDSKGNGRTISGRVFPVVIRAAQVRQSLPVSKNALKNKSETRIKLKPWTTGRWDG